MTKASIITWIAGLPDDSPDLERVDSIRQGRTNDPGQEPFLSLKELAGALGFKSYTSLDKLQIQRIGESWADGRLRYRRSRAEAYLKSPECLAIREELRQKRRQTDARRFLL